MKNYGIKKEKSKIGYDLNAGGDASGRKKSKLKIILVFLCILIPCGTFAGIMYRGYVKTNNAYKEKEREYTNLAMSYVSDGDDGGGQTESGNNSDKNMNKKVDFEGLAEKEKDIYGWIFIPDTAVNYPILQSGNGKKEDYWLNHNMDGSYGYPGTIFTEKMFGKTFDSFNTVIYGHNMKNQTMFGGLHNYSNKEYFESHPYVYLYIQGIAYKYEIICASTISDAHLAIAYNGYNTEQQRQQFIDYLKANAEMSKKEAPTGIYESYVTLSTCTHSDDNRFVVLAKCIDKVSKTGFD